MSDQLITARNVISKLQKHLAVKEAENERLREALKRIKQRSADNLDDRETVHAVHSLASSAIKESSDE